MKDNTKKRLSKCVSAITAIGLCSAMLFSLTSCSPKKTHISETKIQSSLKETVAQSSGKSYHTSSADSLKKITSSGLVELLFNETNFTVSVRDTSYNKIWNTLPAEENEEACAAEVEIINENKKYILNTQDNSVAFGKASFEINDNSVIVNYIITPNQKTADKKSYNENDIAFKLTVNYTLADSSLNVSAKVKNLAKDSNARLTKLRVLPYFGAQQKANIGDFIFVPDGSGALIKTDVKDNSFKEPLNFAVYGNDLSVTKKQEDYSAIVPAYGMKQDNSAFVILITKGDALSSIQADRVRDGNGFFKVGSTFNLTPYAVEKVKSGEKIYLAQSTYKDEVSLCIRFLNGSNANYTGMAAASREQFIREHVLSTKTVAVSENEYLPLELNVIGAAQTEMFRIGKIAPTFLKSYTNFEEAQDMVSRMKAKGINGINLIYKGALSGGLNQKDPASASILKRLGSKSSLNELHEFMDTQNMGLFLDINLLSVSSDGSSSAAHNIYKKESEHILSNELSSAKKVKSNYTNTLLRTDSLKDTIVDILSSKYIKKFTGLCIGDVGSILYSDFAIGKNRQQVSQTISDDVTPLTAGKTLMTYKGNFFMIKDVEFISQLPTVTQVPENDAYVSVPFVQLILHGIVEYSTEPINYSKKPQNAMLRCIEYGACPTYEYTYENISGKSNDIFYYENWINSAADFYQRANKALSDIRSSRMTSHSEVADNVFCTEYNSGEKIYVNYTDNDVVISGLTIPANDFLRIN